MSSLCYKIIMTKSKYNLVNTHTETFFLPPSSLREVVCFVLFLGGYIRLFACQVDGDVRCTYKHVCAHAYGVERTTSSVFLLRYYWPCLLSKSSPLYSASLLSQHSTVHYTGSPRIPPCSEILGSKLRLSHLHSKHFTISLPLFVLVGWFRVSNMARLVLNSVCSQGWPRTPDPLTSNSQMLGLQVHTKHHAGLLPKCWRRNDFKEKKYIFQRWIICARTCPGFH